MPESDSAIFVSEVFGTMIQLCEQVSRTIADTCNGNCKNMYCEVQFAKDCNYSCFDAKRMKCLWAGLPFASSYGLSSCSEAVFLSRETATWLILPVVICLF